MTTIKALQLFAQPYNIDATGFYFSDFETFQERMETLVDPWGQAVEEVEIQLIDGPADVCEVFSAAGVDQGNLDTFFEAIEELGTDGLAALYYLLHDVGMSLGEAVVSVDDVMLYHGTLIEAATEAFDEAFLSSIPTEAQRYIDYEAYAHDLDLGGDYATFDFAGETWVVLNASSV